MTNFSHLKKTPHSKSTLRLSRLFALVFITAGSALLLIELLGRYLGLHQRPLFKPSSKFEYIHVPNQNTLIYRNHFATNSFSMRSDEPRSKANKIILLIGDSVLNGGNTISNEDLASSILQRQLSLMYQTDIQVLNVSSYTWGTSNMVEYLRSFGTFKANLIVYVANSGDFNDPMTFTPIVNVHEKFPGFNSSLAATVLLERGILEIESLFKTPKKEKGRKAKSLDVGFYRLDSLAKASNIPLAVYLHPKMQEVKARKFSMDGLAIQDFFRHYNRPIHIPIFETISPELYQDDIHLNVAGQQFLGMELFNFINRLHAIRPDKTLDATK